MGKSKSFVAGALSAVGVIATAIAAPTYTSVKIATDTESIVVSDFNNTTQAIAAKWASDGLSNPVIHNWANGGVAGNTGVSIGSMPGMAQTELRALNDQRQIVGTGRNPAPDGTFYPYSTSHAYLHSDGRFTDLSAFINGSGAEYSSANGINNQGDVIGMWSEGVGGVRHAFLYSRGSLTEIFPPVGAVGLQSVHDINELGQIVGSYTQAGVLPEPSSMQTFIYDRGTSTKIEVGYSNFASAINDRGDVGGNFFAGTRDSRCYFYSNGAVAFLGPSPRENRMVNCSVRGVSNTGVMVGDQWGPTAAETFPFVYSDGVMSDLNSLISRSDPLVVNGVRLQSVVAINDNGEIVAKTGGEGYYLLTPVAATPPTPPTPPPPPTPPTPTPPPPPPTIEPTPVPTAPPPPPASVPEQAPPPVSAASAPLPAAAAVQSEPAPASGGGAVGGFLLALLLSGIGAKKYLRR